MSMHTKAAAPFAVKAMDEASRTFTGLASTWDLDLGGDVIRKGAFRQTIKAWKDGGKVVPLLDSHNAHSVRAIVGKMIEAKETEDGLEATFEVLEGPDGDEVYRRIKGGFVDGLSIGYEPKVWEKPDEEERRKGVWRIIKEINLMEVSVVLWPMNQSARIGDVKTALDNVHPEGMGDDDYRIAREMASRLGYLLRHAPNAKGTAPEDSAPPPEEPTPEPDPVNEPEAPPAEKAAAAPEADTVPEHIREALLERFARLNKSKVNLGDDDE